MCHRTKPHSAALKAGDAARPHRWKGSNMLPMQTAPNSNAPIPGENAQPILTDEVKDIIIQRMARRESPWRIAAYLQAELRIAIDSDQVLACWNAHNSPATQTGPRPEKASMQIPAEDVTEAIVQRMAPADPPEQTAPVQTVAAAPPNVPDEVDPAPVIAGETERSTLPTRTGRGQEKESTEILSTEVSEFIIARMAIHQSPSLIAELVQEKFGFVVDHDEIIVCWRDRDALPTQTGPRQEKESMPILNDDIKEFIVKRIACYETPSRIAAAVRNNFGIDIDRRQIFAYNPAGSRPPAQRWIDLHAATRAQFLRDVAEIGVAQQVIRLRMLDRFAQMAEDSNRPDQAAKFLEQAARECGGFYERRPRVTVPASRGAAPGSEPSP
jgi:hypothetical protein